MRFADNTELSRKAFQVAWRLAILALPWQTRLFWDAQLAGWPWEQGRVSIYLAWLPLFVAIVLGSFQLKRALPLGLRRKLFWLSAALGACTVIAAPAPATAAIQWWVQVTLLAIFFVTLWRTQAPIRKVAFWSVIALVPHAVLAITQSMTQTIWASKWLGMAAQNPADLGVSVVQTATARFLRAYGGFPHPNILGGWMAVGLIIVTSMTVSSLKIRGGQGALWLTEGLFTLALFYSFSRSAWLAAAVGLTLFVFPSFRAKSRNLDRNLKPDPSTSFNSVQDDKSKSTLLALAIPVALFVALAIIHRDLIFTRLDAGASRLEQKSIITRIQTLKDGIEVYRAVPLFGTGPNSELPVLAAIKDLSTASAPLEPPHMVWLLILVNFGTVGALFIFGFGLYLLRLMLDRWRDLSSSDKPLLIALVSCQLILCSLDHYPWSLWSGQALSSILLFMVFRILTLHDDPSVGA